MSTKFHFMQDNTTAIKKVKNDVKKIKNKAKDLLKTKKGTELYLDLIEHDPQLTMPISNYLINQTKKRFDNLKSKKRVYNFG